MKTIAVIDDDIHIGNMLEELLTREGYGISKLYGNAGQELPGVKGLGHIVGGAAKEQCHLILNVGPGA